MHRSNFPGRKQKKREGALARRKADLAKYGQDMGGNQAKYDAAKRDVATLTLKLSQEKAS